MNNEFQDSGETRAQLMSEAVELQTEWERALKQITNGRQFDDLTLEEQAEWKRVSSEYNEQIDNKLREWERN